MLDNVMEIFDDMGILLRQLKKQTYEFNMKKFREDHGQFFNEMLAALKEADDKAAKADEIGRKFADKTAEGFGSKAKGRKRADMDFLMIYYVFPAVLLTEDENADTLCTGLKNGWNEKFKANISYTDYETLYNGFRTKIFGLF